MSMTPSQRARVASYRKRREPEALSDSQLPGPADFYGNARDLDANPSAGPPPNNQRPAAGNNYGLNENTPRGSGYPAAPHQQQHNHPNSGGERPPFVIGDGGGGGGSGSGGGGGGFRGATNSGSHNEFDPRTQADLTSYVMQLEQQNSDLRRHIQQLQVELQSRGDGGGGAPYSLERSEESKRTLLNDVLTQVDGIIQAHKTKYHAELQKYKAEAEQANMNLKNLRAAIQEDGLDLNMAPSMIRFQRKQQALNLARQQAGGGGSGGPAPLGLSIPEDAQKLLDRVADEIYDKLASAQPTDNKHDLIRRASRESFQNIVVHFTDEMVHNVRRYEELSEELKQELADAHDEQRTMQLTFDAKRVELVAEHQLEMQALNDQLKTFHRVANDDASSMVHQKAFEEYTQLLVEARRETNSVRLELENERTHSAQVCLKLKAALQKRKSEFEETVMARAEEVLGQRERYITELENRLREREKEQPKEFKDVICQAGEPSISVPNADTYVPALLQSMKKDPKTQATNAEYFDREVWRKTQELLQKYGRHQAASANAA